MVRPFFRPSWTDTTSAKPMKESMAKKAHSASARSGSLSSPSITFILLRGYHPLGVSKHSPELETKRFMPVFSDLCCLCHDQPVQKLIAHNVSFIHQFSEVCQLFMCVHRINARRRATWNMKRMLHTVPVSRHQSVRQNLCMGYTHPARQCYHADVQEILAVCTLPTTNSTRKSFRSPPSTRLYSVMSNTRLSSLTCSKCG